MNHKKLDKTLNVKEKCLQQTRLPKRLGGLYACKVRFTCSQFLDDVSLQVDFPPRTSHTLSLIPIKLHKQSLSTAAVGVSSRPHPLRLKPRCSLRAVLFPSGSTRYFSHSYPLDNDTARDFSNSFKRLPQNESGPFTICEVLS